MDKNFIPAEMELNLDALWQEPRFNLNNPILIRTGGPAGVRSPNSGLANTFKRVQLGTSVPVGVLFRIALSGLATTMRTHQNAIEEHQDPEALDLLTEPAILTGI